jgi:hypothetical protein
LARLLLLLDTSARQNPPAWRGSLVRRRNPRYASRQRTGETSILAPSSATRWFYVDNGRRRGPVQLDELIELLLHNRLPPETPVWHTGLAEWVKAATVPEIASELPPPVPAVDLPSVDATAALLPEAADSSESPRSGDSDKVGDGKAEEGLTEVLPPEVAEDALEARHHRRRRHRRHLRQGREPRWDLLAILALALIVLVVVLWRMFRQGDAIPSGIVGLG